LRCFPFQQTKQFAGRQFHSKQQQDIIGMIPVDVNLADFKYPGDVRNPIQVGRLELLFEFTLDPDPAAGGVTESERVEAAFIHVFEPFADERGAPLYRHDGTGRDRLGNTLVPYDCIFIGQSR
jgi:hypothetical protein